MTDFLNPCSCVAVGISLKEFGGAVVQLAGLQRSTVSRDQDGTTPSSWHSVHCCSSEPPCKDVKELTAAAVTESINFELYGRDWSSLAASLESCYLTPDESDGCCSNVNCGNFMCEL